MSWSVSASGKPDEVKAQLAEQFKYPLARRNGLWIPEEKETVRKVSEVLDQICDTTDPDATITVSAYGSGSTGSDGTKFTEQVSLTVTPSYAKPDPAPEAI